MQYTLDTETSIGFTVKRTNNVMCLKMEKLKFLDILNYLAPGFSYDKYLKAFGCQVTKGFLPYEWIDSLEKLNYDRLPAHDHFFSKLKNSNITEEEYKYCLNVWERHDMKTFRDFLIWYNNRDVKPFLEAVAKQMTFYKERGIDMFKNGISVPGLTARYLFSFLDERTYFMLMDKKNRDLYAKLRANIVGGPSNIFHRYHEIGKTKLREDDFGEEAKTCMGVQGLDGNALYLWCLTQQMPTGYFIRRRCNTNFRPERSHRYGILALEWLEWLSSEEGVAIRHQFNGKEKRLGKRQLPVDGWCHERQTVYQFHGKRSILSNIILP